MSCALQIYCAPRRSCARGLRKWRQERILLLYVKLERSRLITSHHVTGELLLFNHKKHELLIGHLLDGLRICPVVQDTPSQFKIVGPRAPQADRQFIELPWA